MKKARKCLTALSLALALVFSVAATPVSAIEIIHVVGPTTISEETHLPENGTVIASDEDKPGAEEDVPPEDGDEAAPPAEEETPGDQKDPADEAVTDKGEDDSAGKEDPAGEEDPAEDEGLALDGEFVVQNGVLKQYRGEGPAVVIPEGVTQISGKVFQNNASITSVTLPATLKELPRTVGQRKAGVAIQGQSQSNATVGGWQVGTFAGCVNLTAIHAPAHLQEAADWEMAHKDLLLREQNGGVYACSGYVGKGERIIFPEDVAAITDGKGIAGNRTITAVTFAGVVADIPADLFKGCDSLALVEAPEGCGLKLDHFTACASMTYEGLPEFVQAQPIFDIAQGVLSGYHGLERDVVVPDGVTEIAFPFHAGENAIRSITLPDSLKTIRPGALQSYFGIETVILPDSFSLRNMEPDALDGLDETVQVHWQGESKDWGAWKKELQELWAKRQAELNKEQSAKQHQEQAIASHKNSASYQERLAANQRFLEETVAQAGEMSYKYTWVTEDIQNLSDELCGGLSSDREKVAALHEWVTENIYYNYPALSDHSVRHDSAQEAYETRTCVCQGYADLMQALCWAQEIPAVVAVGPATGGLHAWNAIQLDGQWLWTDACWDTYNAYYGSDSWSKRNTRLDYFLCSTEFISTDHRADYVYMVLRNNISPAGYYGIVDPMKNPNMCSHSFGDDKILHEALEVLDEANALRAEEGLEPILYDEEYKQLLYPNSSRYDALRYGITASETSQKPVEEESVVTVIDPQEEWRQKEAELEKQYLEELKNESAQDIGLSDWAKDEVIRAMEHKLVPQDMRNSYTTNITRLDFCRLIVQMVEQSGKVKDLPTGTVNPFTDVNDRNVTLAYALGIVKGTSATAFNPNGQITRQEAATMLARAANALGCVAGQGESFADADAFADWGKDAIAFTSSLADPTTGNKVMQGTGGGRFTPLGTYTREQAIVTMYRLFNVCRA